MPLGRTRKHVRERPNSSFSPTTRRFPRNGQGVGAALHGGAKIDFYICFTWNDLRLWGTHTQRRCRREDVGHAYEHAPLVASRGLTLLLRDVV